MINQKVRKFDILECQVETKRYAENVVGAMGTKSVVMNELESEGLTSN
jgi:hypothetical protein